MNAIEMISGLTVEIPNREYNLLLKMMDVGQHTFKRSEFSPRAEILANSLVSHHVLDRDDDRYILRQFTILDK